MDRPRSGARSLGAAKPKDSKAPVKSKHAQRSTVESRLAKTKARAKVYQSRTSQRSKQGRVIVRLRELDKDQKQYELEKEEAQLTPADAEFLQAQMLQERTAHLEKRRKERAQDQRLAKLTFRRVADWWGRDKQPIVLRDDTNEACDKLYFPKKRIVQLKRIFDTIDVDGSGEIDHWEFLDFVREPRTEFALEFFAGIDLNGDGGLDFDEFLQAVIQYSVKSKSDILEMCFMMFDEDKSGSISIKEYAHLANAFREEGDGFAATLKRMDSTFDLDNDGELTIKEFSALNSRYPLLLYPAFRMQEKIQSHTLGVNAWVRILKHKHYRNELEDHLRRTNGIYPEPTLRQKLRESIFGKEWKDFTEPVGRVAAAAREATAEGLRQRDLNIENALGGGLIERLIDRTNEDGGLDASFEDEDKERPVDELKKGETDSHLIVEHELEPSNSKTNLSSSSKVPSCSWSLLFPWRTQKAPKLSTFKEEEDKTYGMDRNDLLNAERLRLAKELREAEAIADPIDRVLAKATVTNNVTIGAELIANRISQMSDLPPKLSLRKIVVDSDNINNVIDKNVIRVCPKCKAKVPGQQFAIHEKFCTFKMTDKQKRLLTLQQLETEYQNAEGGIWKNGTIDAVRPFSPINGSANHNRPHTASGTGGTEKRIRKRPRTADDRKGNGKTRPHTALTSSDRKSSNITCRPNTAAAATGDRSRPSTAMASRGKRTRPSTANSSSRPGTAGNQRRVGGLAGFYLNPKCDDEPRPSTRKVRPHTAQPTRASTSLGLEEGVLSSTIEMPRKFSALSIGSTSVAEVLDLDDETGGEDGVFKLIMSPTGGKNSTFSFLTPLNLQRERSRSKVSPG